jgi:hemerythrin-like domain-containing protein
MEQIGKPIEVNRQFIKFIETDIEPEYNRVFEMLLQKLKDELDQKFTNEGKILKKENDNKYKNGSDRD